MDDRHFARILQHFDLSWEGYRKVRKSVKKRLSHHMLELGCRNVDEYLGLLESSQIQREHCERLLSVSISRFFRDGGLWRILEDLVLPDLAARYPNSINVWSAGCARGEEIYSFKIVWDLLCSRIENLPELALWATDLNPAVLDLARDGVYSRSSLKELPQTLCEKYFRSLGKTSFAVVATLKEGISWTVNDLLKDEPPRMDFHIIFARNNLLTYYNEALVRPALGKLIDSLAVGGYLITGAREKLPAAISGLELCPAFPGIHVKRAGCA